MRKQEHALYRWWLVNTDYTSYRSWRSL